MDTNVYYLIAIKYNSSLDLNSYINEIKDIVCSINYELDPKEDTKIFLNNISLTGIQVILRIQENIKDDREISISKFKKHINNFIISKGIFKLNTLEDTIFEIELSEMVVNKMIVTMHQNKKKEFDLVTAIKFNENIEDILDRKIQNELNIKHDSYDEDNKFRGSGKEADSSLKYIDYSTKDLKKLTENIQKTINLNVDIINEIDTISRLHNKINKPIHFIFDIEHSDLYEDEIIQIIFSHQFNLKVLSKPYIYELMIDEIVNTNRNPFSNNNNEIFKLQSRKKGMGILITQAEKLIFLNEKELDLLVNFINKVDSTCIININYNKINDPIKFSEVLDKLKQSIIYRKVVIKKPSINSYCKNIIDSLDKRGYKLSKSFNPEELIKYINNIGTDLLQVSKINFIVDKIIFNHEIDYSGNVVKTIKRLNPPNNINTDDKIETGLEKLEKMIGINHLKSKVLELIALYKINLERKTFKLSYENINMHMCIRGNPGGGKTTFARVLSQILKEEGVLTKGQFIEVSRDDLIGKYVGWTAKIVTDYFKKAEGGVLFIDEAYLLSSDFKEGYGEEAIGSIVKNMENFRDRVVVIFAGYPLEMDNFINTNPGLKSRIGIDITIDDYDANELLEIFKLFIKERDYTIENEALKKVHKHIINIVKSNSDNFGNARYIRNLVERIQLSQSKRISCIKKITKEDLVSITIDDLSFLNYDSLFSIKNESKSIGFRN